MADGSITFSTKLDNTQLEKDLTRSTKKIESMEQKLAKKEADRLPIVEQLKEANREAEEAYASVERLRKALATSQSVTAIDGKGTKDPETYIRELERQPQIKAELAEQERLLRENEKIAERLSAQDERTVGAIQTQTAELDREKAKAGELAQQLQSGNSASEKMGEAIDRASGHMDRFTKRVQKLMSRVFVFTLITIALRKMRTWMSNVIATNDEARAAMARLKGALLTLAQPLVNVIIPAFTALVNILTKVVLAIAKVVSWIFGTTAEKSAEAAKNLYDEQQALEGVGSAAKEAAGELAGFDEINTIGSDNSGGAGSGGLSGNTTPPDFSGLIGGELDKIAALIGGALLAVGAILAFSGINIPLGIGLMAIGALALAGVIMENWGAIAQALRGPLGALTAMLSAALLVLGAILVFSGVAIGPGLGLMIAGATGLAMTVAANWDTIVAAMRGPIGDLTALLSTAFLVIGAVLAFTGANLPLGIGLMIAGAAGLAAYAAVNWDTVSEALESPIGTIVALVSAAFLVLGAVLLFSGANIPLGLGLLAVGAIGLATSMAANWDTIQNTLQGPIGTITTLVSTALLVLGAVLTFSGVALHLGLGLMAAGAIGLATSIAANWKTITSTVGSTADAITAIVSAALLVLGIILIFTGAGIPLGLGLLLAGAVGLAATVAPNWNFILQKIQGAWSAVKEWWGRNVSKFLTWDYWENLGANMIEGLLQGLAGIFSGLKSWASNVWSSITGAFSGKNAKSSISNSANRNVSVSASRYASIPPITGFNIPKLATGAVIPPNREFLAVLGDQRSGTNIEAPAELIRQMVAEGIKATGASGKSGQPIQVNIMLDKRVLARAMVSEVNDMARQAGKPVWFL